MMTETELEAEYLVDKLSGNLQYTGVWDSALWGFESGHVREETFNEYKDRKRIEQGIDMKQWRKEYGIE